MAYEIIGGIKNMKKIMKCIAGSFLLVAVACEETNPLDAAWSKFGERDYAGAHSEFASLVEGEGSAAYVGLGWTTLMMDSLAESDVYFTLASEDSLLEGYAGWSIVAWLQGQHTLCIDRAEFVFRNAGGYDAYVFPYDPEITYHDLLLHQGFSYYYNQNFFACLNVIQRIDPSFSVAMNDAQIQNKLLAELESLTQVYN